MLGMYLHAGDESKRAAEITVICDDLERTMLEARKQLLRLRPDHRDYPRWWNEITRAAERLEAEASHLSRIHGAYQADERARGV